MEVVQGVTYRPRIWSVFGRVHPETQAWLSTMVVQAARRVLRDHRLVLRRICSVIVVALVRRAARSEHSCMPGLDAVEEAGLLRPRWLRGGPSCGASNSSRAVPT